MNYTYIFNVCGAISGHVPDKCKEAIDLTSAGALQVNTHDDNDDWCYVVGNYAKESISSIMMTLQKGYPSHTPEATAVTELRGNSLCRCSVLID